jgi:membrane dipeptidase
VSDSAQAVSIPVIDGHIDTLLSIYADRDGERRFDEQSESGHADRPRLAAGGVAAAFFATFVSNPDRDGRPGSRPPEIDHEVARVETNAMLDLLDEWVERGDLRLVTDSADLDAVLGGSDEIGAVAHLEGAEAVAPDLSNLDALYDRGVRSIGLTWSRPNEFGHGVPFVHDETPDIGPGLTDAGEDLVAECDRRGIVVDCAHLNAAGIRDVAEISENPLVVSHTGAHAIAPAARNLTDDLLELVAESGGVVGITFAAGHLRPDGESDPETPISVLVDHVEHVAAVAGVEHVAFGSDFDGATVIEPVADASRFPVLVEELRERGFSDSEIEQIAHGNWLRVLRETVD